MTYDIPVRSSPASIVVAGGRQSHGDEFEPYPIKANESCRLSCAARNWNALVNLARDGIYALLRELRRAGYVRFERKRDARGRMRGGTYIVSEVPAPHPDSPDVDEPDPAAPSPANPDALPSTERNLRTTTTTRPTDTHRRTKASRLARGLIFPQWVPPEMHAPAQRLVANLAAEAAQLVIDEWAGALAAGAIHRSPLGYLRALAARHRAGDMAVRYASSGP